MDGIAEILYDAYPVYFRYYSGTPVDALRLWMHRYAYDFHGVGRIIH